MRQGHWSYLFCLNLHCLLDSGGSEHKTLEDGKESECEKIDKKY